MRVSTLQNRLIGLATCGVVCLGLLLTAAVRLPQDEGAFSLGTASCFDLVEEGGALHILAGLPGEGEVTSIQLFHTRSEDGGATWSAPVPVDTTHAPPGRHHRGNDPQLAVHGDRLLAVWTAQGDGPWGSGPLGASLSKDGGQTWQAVAAPAVPGAGEVAGYRFPAVAATPEGFHAIWIHAEEKERSLRYAKMPVGAGLWTQPAVIDPRICACCWNRLKVDGNGRLLALYRDHDPSDMALAISEDGGDTWTRQGSTGDFGWFFEGCPHIGGALASLPKSEGQVEGLLATVWSGHETLGGTYILRSLDLGQTWDFQRAPGSHERGRRTADLEVFAEGTAIFAWDEHPEAGERTVFFATSTDRGATWSIPSRLSSPGRAATHPRVVVSGETAFIAWTETGESGTATLAHRIVREVPVAARSLAGASR